MSGHLGLTVAQLHGVVAARRRSAVFHIYCGPTTPGGRTPRFARPVCNAHTRPLTIATRRGVVVDLQGRRMCARCSARLSALARRAEQPPNNVDARRAFWEGTGITSTDLVTALAIATTVEETHAIGHVTTTLFGPCNPIPGCRPAAPGMKQGRYDFEVELHRRRDQLRTAELTPEQRQAALEQRELDAARDAQLRADRKRSAARDRAIDRHLAGTYLTPHERELVNSA